MKKTTIAGICILIIVVLWFALGAYRLVTSSSMVSCHIALCEKEGLNSTLTHYDRFYYHKLPADYVSCYTPEGGYTTIHDGTTIKALCP